MRTRVNDHPPVQQQLGVNDDTAARLGISVRHLRQLIRDGSLPVWRAGNRILIDPVRLQMWIDQGGTAAES